MVQEASSVEAVRLFIIRAEMAYGEGA